MTTVKEDISNFYEKLEKRKQFLIDVRNRLKDHMLEFSSYYSDEESDEQEAVYKCVYNQILFMEKLIEPIKNMKNIDMYDFINLTESKTESFYEHVDEIKIFLGYKNNWK